MRHTLTAKLMVHDDGNPLTKPLFDYAEVEAEVKLECDLYFGFDGNYFEPPEKPRASLVNFKLVKFHFYPIDEEPLGEIKAAFLATPEMMKIVEKTVMDTITDEWWEYERKVFTSYEDWYNGLAEDAYEARRWD